MCRVVQKGTRMNLLGYTVRIAAAGLVAAILVSPVRVDAQSTFGSLRGNTTDASGAAVPKASVALHSVDENTDVSTLSDDSGNFVFENLKPGHYTITASKEGFARAVVNQVELTARQNLRVDVSLAVAAQAQTVEVNAAAVAVNTENATLSDSKEADAISPAADQLPVRVEQSSGGSRRISRGNEGLAREYRGRGRDIVADWLLGGWNFDRQRAFQRRAGGRLPIHGKHRRDEGHGIQQQRGIRPDRRCDLRHQERNQSSAWQRV